MNERYRVEPTGRGFLPFRVVAGDGERELFIGHRKSCERVAAELTTAFRDGEFVGSRDYDALHAEAEALRAENARLDPAGSMAKCLDAMRDRGEHAKTIDRMRLELEAARGLLRDMRHAARINPSCQYGMVNPCRCGYCVDLRVDAFLTATQSPEVRQEPASLPDSEFVNEFMDWWERHGQYVRSGGGDYERTFAFEAWRYLMPKVRAAEQGERQEASTCVGNPSLPPA